MSNGSDYDDFYNENFDSQLDELFLDGDDDNNSMEDVLENDYDFLPEMARETT